MQNTTQIEQRTPLLQLRTEPRYSGRVMLLLWSWETGIKQ